MNQALKYSLQIVYTIINRYEAAYISEFYKMCGFFVCEKEMPEGVVNYKRLMENAAQFEHVLFLGIGDVDFGAYFELDLKNHDKKLHKISAHEFFLQIYQNDDFSALCSLLKESIQKVRPAISESFDGLIDQYVRKQYCRLSYKKRYFGNVVDKQTKEYFRQEFLSVIQELKQVTDPHVLPHCLYAQYLCARKVNDVCMELQLNFHFRPKTMIEKCLQILGDAPEFFNAYVLAASFGTCDASLSASVIPLYQNALQYHKYHPALANTYYRLGQYYEKHQGDMKNANRAYDRAVENAPDYFRAWFKKGGELLNGRKYASAIETYKKVIEELSCKRNQRRLFPVEYEYLCKCYILLGLIYQRHWGDSVNGEYQYRKAVKLVEQELENSSFFEDFFSDSQGMYLKFLKKKISLNEYILVDKYR